MQANLSNVQLQQMQILQQQQRLATMMQQKQKNHPQSWDNGMGLKQEQHQLSQSQEQPFPTMQQQQYQQRLLNSQKEFNMLGPHSIPQPTMIPSRPSFPQTMPLQNPMTPQQSMLPPTNIIPQQPVGFPTNALHQPSPSSFNSSMAANKILVQTDTQRSTLEQYKKRDELYQETLNTQHKRHLELAQSKKKLIEQASLERRSRMQQGPATVFGYGYKGYRNGKTGTQTRIQYPAEKKKRVGKREPLRFSYESLKEQAVKEEVLVPIRIELEHEGYKIRDTFTWNLNESLITPEQFAEIICEDLKLPTSYFSDSIARAITEQIEDFNLNASSMVKEEAMEEIEESRQPAATTEETVNDTEEVENKESNSEPKQGYELRTIIKLDITVGNWELVDQFEWDIGCPNNSPEEFAARLVKDLGLSGEFKTAIAHSIREQIHVYIKSLLLVGYEFNSSSTIDDEIKSSFLPQLEHSVRENSNIEMFTPSMIELTDAALEKLDKDLMREARRKRRGTRARRGVVLPDREPQKTHRTGLSVPPEQEAPEEQYVNGVLIDSQHSSKRTAALKARMNIAAEAAIGDDIEGLSAPQPNTIPFTNSRNNTLSDYQRRLPNSNYGNMNAWQLNNHNMLK